MNVQRWKKKMVSDVNVLTWTSLDCKFRRVVTPVVEKTATVNRNRKMKQLF